MIPGKDYGTMIREQNKSARILPLCMAWEFMPRPIQQPVNYPSNALAMLAQTYRWQLSLPLRQLIGQQKWAVVVTDRWEIIQYVNDSFEQMTGYDLAEVTGRKPSFLQGKETNSATRQRMRMAIEGEQPLKESVLNYRKDGTMYWCDITIFPVRNDHRQVVNFIALEQETPV